MASSLSVECNVFEMDKKTLVFTLGRGESVKHFPRDMLCSIDFSIGNKLRGMTFPSYVILKADI